jgi:hypothetical protein
MIRFFHGDLDPDGGGDLTSDLREGPHGIWRCSQLRPRVELPPAKTLWPCPGDGACHQHDGGNPPDLRTISALHAGCVASQDLPVRPAALQRRIPASDEKSIQIQSGRQEPTSDLKVEPHARCDPLDVPCVYHTRAHDTHSAAAGCGSVTTHPEKYRTIT